MLLLKCPVFFCSVLSNEAINPTPLNYWCAPSDRWPEDVVSHKDFFQGFFKGEYAISFLLFL